MAIVVEMPLKSGPTPSDPIPPAGDITIQVKSKPEPNVTRDTPADDFIVYPNHLCFTFSESTSRLKMPGVTSKMRRIGNVAPAFANWSRIPTRYNPTTKAEEATRENVRFIGVSYDGVTDGKAARDFPDEHGRFAVAVQGAVTIFCDGDNISDARVGDYLEWRDEPAEFVWSDGVKGFRPVKIRKYTGGDASHIFGVLLERGVDTGRKNEARVLLNPAFGNKAQTGEVRTELTATDFNARVSKHISLNSSFVTALGENATFSTIVSPGRSAEFNFKGAQTDVHDAANLLLTQDDESEGKKIAEAFLKKHVPELSTGANFYDRLVAHLRELEGGGELNVSAQIGAE